MANQIGKRYVSDETGVEVLCTKAGEGEIKCNDEPMTLQVPRALPSSD